MERLTTEILDPCAKEKHYTLNECPRPCSHNCFDCKVLMQAIDRLAYYENMEEQGRLVIYEEEVALALMRANVEQEKNKLALLRIIKELSDKLENALHGIG